MIMDAPFQMDLNKYILKSPNQALSPADKAPRLVQFGPYSWVLDRSSPVIPFPKMYHKQISFLCTECHSWTRGLLSLNLENIRAHWQNQYLGLLHRWLRQSDSSDIPSDDANQSSDFVDSVDASNSTSDSFFSLEPPFPESSFESTRVVSVQMVSDHDVFDDETYKSLMLNYLVNHDLPFAHVDSASFQALLSYATHCKNGFLSSVTRRSAKLGLDALYDEEVQRFKIQLSKLEGKFAVTIDEWNSDGHFDVFAVTLHFHNDDFTLENHVLGFEVLNKATSYTSELLWRNVDDFLAEYDIKDRIIAITRNNGDPFNTLIDPFTKKFNNHTAGFQFKGDVQCVGHVLNSTIEAFLNYTFFKQTERVIELIKVFEKEYPEFDQLIHRVTEIPQMVKSTINAVRSNPFLRASFQSIVSQNLCEEKSNTSHKDTFSSKTSWVSTYDVLDRFLHFRNELAELLRQAKHQPKAKQDGFKLKSFEIEGFEWNYLTTIRDILQIFVNPMARLQGYHHETVNLTIPYVARILKALEKLNSRAFSQKNPLLSLGLKDACETLLQSYPIRNGDIGELKTLYLATVLDPRLKLGVFRDLGFSSSIIDCIENYLLEVYASYRQEYEKNEKNTMDISERRNSDEHSESVVDMDDFFLNDETLLDDDEIRLYLSEKREPQSRSIKEFYQSRKGSFPVLYQIAKDFLSVSAVSSPPETLFSPLKNMVPEQQNKLLPSTIKISATLRSRGVVIDEGMSFSDHSEDYDQTENSSVLKSTHAHDIEQEEGVGVFDGLILIDYDDICYERETEGKVR